MTSARIIEKGVIACFEAGLRDPDGELANAEVSAAAWDGQRLLMASDKPIPGTDRSSVFTLELADGRPRPGTLEYLTAPLIGSARKYEDFALTVDGHYMIATTGFDRVGSDTASQHHYNQLLVWPRDEPESVRVAAATLEYGILSSVALRDDLSSALGAPYFKIEGLAAVPAADGGDDLLLFGVREVGDDHENFEYVCRVVAAPYRVRHGVLSFTGNFEAVYEFDASHWDGVRYEVGLSSLEYDPANRRLFLLTSFEVEEDAGDQIGGYLWQLSLEDFHARREPVLVENEAGQVLEFVNKAEGVAVLDENRLFIVYDNDRKTALEDDHPHDERQPHEAPYTLLGLN